ncbi:hypothetical protein C2869_15855 [Saccharobesus litoralis]|uniref:Uncharacterized protein n=1 Tax=Saccharobesus litoralis TaxID=2172099 RepID=A0A2S0VUP0_9ALTE|nr:YaeQ family protein [Saccharobesus litoralis]AWB67810.1 hypothetical protein C2869_15855 [Saccharobesus litoralis]
MLVKAKFDISRIDADYYEHFSHALSYDDAFSPSYFIEKLLAMAMLHHNNIQVSPNLVYGDSPELFVKRNQHHYEHWFNVGKLELSSLEKAEAKSDHVWLFYCERDENQKLLSKINKHPKLQMVEFESDLIEGLARNINKNMAWTILVDQDELTVATEAAYFQSRFQVHHPLTIPVVDLIH